MSSSSTADVEGVCCNAKRGDGKDLDASTSTDSKEVERQCACCSEQDQDFPKKRTPHCLSIFLNTVNDGRRRPVVTNFRCACGTFRGCCWGTCYPGCKCPEM